MGTGTATMVTDTQVTRSIHTISSRAKAVGTAIQTKAAAIDHTSREEAVAKADKGGMAGKIGTRSPRRRVKKTWWTQCERRRSSRTEEASVVVEAGKEFAFCIDP